MKKFIRKTRLLLLLAGAVSCSTASKTTYWKDFATGEEIASQSAPDIRIEPMDRLLIEVVSIDPTLSAPFNSGLTLLGTDTPRATSGASYVVDAKGDIDFPILGLVKAEGKTVGELQNELRERISSSGYIKEPVVNVKLDAFTLTVIKFGVTETVRVDDGKRTILQVVAPGDNEKIKDVMVIRTENGVKKAYSVDFQSKDIFSSPVFYLQQNDIVYVKPEGWKFKESTQSIFTGISTIMGLFNTFFILRLYYSK